MSCIYVVLNVGLTFCVDSNTKALSISGNFPIYKNLDISISGEHSWREDDIWGSTLKVKAQKIMSNIVYHFSTDSLFTPYIGAGIGLAFYEVDYSYYWGSNSKWTENDDKPHFERSGRKPDLESSFSKSKV